MMTITRLSEENLVTIWNEVKANATATSYVAGHRPVPEDLNQPQICLANIKTSYRISQSLLLG